MNNETRKSRNSELSSGGASGLLRPHVDPSGRSQPHRPGAQLAAASAGDGARALDRPARAVDIVCAGMYRACSTWQYEVVAHLVEHEERGQRLGYLTSAEYRDLARADAKNRQQFETPEWRVFKSHDGDRVFARAAGSGRLRILYAYRDIRDVILSLMHKRGLTFEQLLRQGMIHQILANDRFWMGQPDILVQRYDDLIARPAEGVMAIARYLGIALADSEATRIAAMYSPEANRARTQALRDRLEQSGIDLDQAGNAQICDPKTLLHWNHLRPAEGGGGTWNRKAAPGHHVVVRRLCGGWLRARGYPVETRESAAIARSHVPARDRFAIERDLIVGRLNFWAQSVSRANPNLVRRAKRLAGLATTGSAGAIAWADPVDATREPNPPR